MSRTADAGNRLGLIGRDLADRGRARRAASRAALPLGIAILLAALFLSALRIDILRMRYAKTEALGRESALREREHELLVRVRALRSPARLAPIARERGFAPPERLIELDGARYAQRVASELGSAGRP